MAHDMRSLLCRPRELKEFEKRNKISYKGNKPYRRKD